MRFRKKPVVIEAVRFSNDHTPAPRWLLAAYDSGQCWTNPEATVLTIKTLEGEMRASTGDWIIQGIKGELYPCRDDIFQATYEPAGE